MVLYSCDGVGHVVCVLGNLPSTADVLFKYCCSIYCECDISCHAYGDSVACIWTLPLVDAIRLSSLPLSASDGWTLYSSY
jgi:hypothetical protein